MEDGNDDQRQQDESTHLKAIIKFWKVVHISWKCYNLSILGRNFKDTRKQFNTIKAATTSFISNLQQSKILSLMFTSLNNEKTRETATWTMIATKPISIKKLQNNKLRITVNRNNSNCVSIFQIPKSPGTKLVFFSVK